MSRRGPGDWPARPPKVRTLVDLLIFGVVVDLVVPVFFFSSRRRHTRCGRDWSSDVCSSDLVSLIFPIPLPYRHEIAGVPGVTGISWANWFGGVYGEPNDFKNFWPRFAVDPDTYFDLYPEFQLPPDQLAAFRKERNACIIGRKLAQQHGFKLGDVITMEGDIYPGSWQWVVRGIYAGRDPSTDETQMFFQFAYLFEQVRQREPGRPVDAGFYVLRVGSSDAMARVARAVDTQFVNSRSPTETES